MKITSTHVSIVLAIAAAAGVYLIARRASNAVSGAIDEAWDAASYGVQQITPWNRDNIIATTVNKIGGALVTDPLGPGKNADGSWTLGGAAYDVQQSLGLSTLGLFSPVQAVSDMLTKGAKTIAGKVSPAESIFTQPDGIYDQMGTQIHPYP